MNLECFPWQGISIDLDHVFSVECDAAKCQIIIDEHKPRHVFSDVSVFKTGKGKCLMTGKVIKIDRTSCGIDILFSGPACTDLSGLKSTRSRFAGCYEFSPESAEGASAFTYQYGYRKVLALWKTCVFFKVATWTMGVAF